MVSLENTMPEWATTFSVYRIRQVVPTGERFRFNAADGRCESVRSQSARARAHRNAHRPEVTSIMFAIACGDQTTEEHNDGTLAVTTTCEKELKACVWSFSGAATINPDGEATIRRDYQVQRRWG
jgi:hypothetical protein